MAFHQLPNLQSTLPCNVTVLDLAEDADQVQFWHCVPEVDYRFQLLREEFCTTINVVVFTVATMKIEYVVIALVSITIDKGVWNMSGLFEVQTLALDV